MKHTIYNTFILPSYITHFYNERNLNIFRPEDSRERLSLNWGRPGPSARVDTFLDHFEIARDVDPDPPNLVNADLDPDRIQDNKITKVFKHLLISKSQKYF